MAKVNIKGTIVSDDDKWIYDLFGINCVCPANVHSEIKAAKGEDLEVEINSGGGDVVAGNEIYTALRMYKGKVLITISGMAASAASYIATARGCEMTPVGIFMIHNASGVARGDYHVMDKESEILQTINKAITAAYMEKTKLSQEELLELMDKESWLTAEQALQYGFVDSIVKNQEYTKTASRKAGFSNGKIAALYNAATVLNRETIDKTKEMFASQSGITTPESIVPMLAESVSNSTEKNIKKMEVSKMDETKESISTVEELIAAYPSLTGKIKDDASLEAAKAENERIKAIDEISGQISAEMVHEAKYGEKKITAESLALEAFKKNGIMAKEAFKEMKADIAESGTDSVTVTAAGDQTGDDLDQETKVKNLASKFAKRK